jgi:hypothetical protein
MFSDTGGSVSSRIVTTAEGQQPRLSAEEQVVLQWTR